MAQMSDGGRVEVTEIRGARTDHWFLIIGTNYTAWFFLLYYK